MALENLSNIFEQESLEVSDIERNIASQESTPTILGLNSVYDDLVKLSPILYQEPNSPLSIDTSPIEFPFLQTGENLSFESNPTENSSEKVKKRKDDLFVNLGDNNKLGLNKLVLESLYKNNHRGSPDREPIDIGKVDENGNAILVNTLQSGIGNLGNLDIKGYSTTWRNGLFFLKEPYIVHNIPKSGVGSALQGVGQNRDFIPWRAALDDVSRLAQFYTSPAGVAFMAKENITNVLIGEGIKPTEPFSFTMAPPIPVPNTGFLNFYQQSVQGAGLGSIRKPFKPQYSDKADIGLPFGNLGDNLLPLPVPPLPEGFLTDESPGFIKKKIISAAENLLEKIADISVPNIGRPTPFIDLSGGPKKTEYDDKINKSGQSAGFVVGKKDDEIAPKGLLGNGTGDFYVRFKDLRHDLGDSDDDGVFLYFRGFVTGITENVSPAFSSTNYIGRSEAVYQYERVDRDISFNLKVYPNNKKEFDTMYKKLNYLTGMAHPMYLPDVNDNALVRMKAPFTELYMAHIGTRAKGQFGFIKSITYTVSETGDWDSQTALPRLFDIAISYQILNKRAPSFRTPFYRGQNSAGYSS